MGIDNAAAKMILLLSNIAGDNLSNNAVSAAGDVNGDGFADLICTAVAQGLVGYPYTCPDMVGGGNSAGQAAMFLSRSARHVHLLVRGPSLALSMSSYLSSRLEADPAISIHYDTEIDTLHGDAQLDAVTIRHADGNAREIACCALFIMVGAAPNSGTPAPGTPV